MTAAACWACRPLRDCSVIRVKNAHAAPANGRQFFANCIDAPPSMTRGQRGKGKSRDPDRDYVLLRSYDDAIANCPPAEMAGQVGLTAKRLAEQEPGQYGASADAIERQLRRLLAERLKTLEEAEAWFKGWREEVKRITGEYPEPSLLSAPPGK
jgi:hypothetical protein